MAKFTVTVDLHLRIDGDDLASAPDRDQLISQRAEALLDKALADRSAFLDWDVEEVG